MDSYNIQKISNLFEIILRQNISAEGFSWLKDRTSPIQNTNHFNTSFVTAPRKTGKHVLKIDQPVLEEINNIRPGLNITNWTTDRLARVWLLLQLNEKEKDTYFITIENLFKAAEVNELVALYSSLPLLAYPEIWAPRCAEGIRNNIADVLTVIMCNNPYPYENLGEAAWNQLVLKAFFTDKPINEIVGLDKRANEKLAHTLSDYAHERWAAHRDVNPLLWRCVGPFLNEQLLPDMQKLLSSSHEIEKEAASLALHSSNYLPAQQLLPANHRSAIENGTLSWEVLAQKMNHNVLQS